VTQELDHLAVAVHVAAIFDRLGVRHTIGGSIAASFAGEPRSTIDIDFVVALTHGAVAALTAAMEPTRRKTSCCRSFAGSAKAEDSPIGNGATSYPLSARRARASTARISQPTRRRSKLKTFSIERCVTLWVSQISDSAGR
jgi:hypothetical protein